MIARYAAERDAALASRKVAFYEAPGPIPRRFFLYRPSTEVPGLPPVVSVHGIARNAAAHAFRLQEEAEKYGLTIVAPLFEKELYGQYQQLLDPRRQARSDVALLDILDAAARLSKINAERALLFGYSGGAQFGHRFVLSHPGRVASAVHVGAGWYTFPEPRSAYPYGFGVSDIRRGLPFDPVAAARVPQHVFVGELDVERDSSLRQSKIINRQQGKTRVERAQRWVAAMGEFIRHEHGLSPPTFLTLPAVGHSFSESVERADLPRLVFERFAADAGLVPVRRQ